MKVPVTVRRADEAALDLLVARDPDGAQYERERFIAQERDEAALLVAFDDNGDVRGRVRLRWFSKYDNVRAALGDFPEINALDAWPTGTGVGTQIIAACEAAARERGYPMVGIGVLETNLDARRLYERLGYDYWGDVVDEWSEVDADGNVTVVHEDPAVYLVKKI